MDLSIKNNLVLITGGAGTLGLATSRCFLEEGTRVVMLDLAARSQDDAVNALMAEFPERAAFIAMDLSDAASIKEAVCEVLARFGAVHTVVSNAATFHFSPMRQWTTDAPLDAHYTVGLRGPVRLLREVWNRCPESLGGSVVIVSSVAGHVSEPDAFAYTPIKSAQKGLMLSCAHEMAKHGGWAVAISPGHIWSAVHKSRADAAGMDRADYERMMPNIQSTMLARFLEPHEVAQWIVLASSPLGKALTGQDVHVTLGIEAGGFNRAYATAVEDFNGEKRYRPPQTRQDRRPDKNP